MPAAEAHHLAALEPHRQHDRADRLGDDLYNLAYVAMLRQDLDTARQRFVESGNAFSAQGQSEGLAGSRAARGALEPRAGNLTLARDLLEEGRRLHYEQGNNVR